MAELPIPYCGSAPTPDVLWQHWNLDPVLLGVLVAVPLACAVARPSAAGMGAIGATRLERLSFYSGWLVLALALVSPLCSLSVALFSARVGQHMIVTLVAAPLIVLGRPAALIGAAPAGLRVTLARALRPLANPVVAGILYAVLLWAWHTPLFYAATFGSDLAYWLMHLTLFGSALMLWRALLDEGADQLRALLTGFATSLQMGLLGAVLTFATRPLFGDHLLTAGRWGFSPLEDQQLGGLIMWVPGCSVFVAAGLYSVSQMLRSLEDRDAHRGLTQAQRPAPA